MRPKMELLVWVGDFGLVSMNAECIRAIVYVKLAKAPVRIIYSNNPYFTLHHDFPVFRHGNIVLTDFNDMVGYLRMRNFVVDYGLSDKQRSEAYAIMNMVVSNLRPVLQYIFWIDSCNYDELTSRWYAQVMHLPFQFMYTRTRRSLAISLVETMFPTDENKEVIRNSLYSNAMESFACLVSRLGCHEYFYGNSPTTADAVVYAYLAPLVKVPFPSDDIPKLLARYPQLVEYVKRVDEKIFSEVTFKNKYLEGFDPTKRTAAREEDEFATSFVVKIIMLCAAASCMVAYAASKEMIDLDRWRRYITN